MRCIASSPPLPIRRTKSSFLSWFWPMWSRPKHASKCESKVCMVGEKSAMRGTTWVLATSSANVLSAVSTCKPETGSRSTSWPPCSMRLHLSFHSSRAGWYTAKNWDGATRSPCKLPQPIWTTVNSGLKGSRTIMKAARWRKQSKFASAGRQLEQTARSKLECDGDGNAFLTS